MNGERNKRQEEGTMEKHQGAVWRWKRAHMGLLAPLPCGPHGAGAKTARAGKQGKTSSQGKMKPDSKLAKEILEALQDVM